MNCILKYSVAATLVILVSCQKELSDFNKTYPAVDSALWPYYQEFEFEAAKRGYEYDLNTLRVSAQIDDLEEPGVAGVCQFGSFIDNHITIDQNFWNRSTNLMKEMVVFHELGHCALLRGHEESQDRNGICLSIMRSGTGTCRDAYSTSTRSLYLDELFSQARDD